eukprot:14594419-Alexandrium_andersonii.AAC.1
MHVEAMPPSTARMCRCSRPSAHSSARSISGHSATATLLSTSDCPARPRAMSRRPACQSQGWSGGQSEGERG